MTEHFVRATKVELVEKDGRKAWYDTTRHIWEVPSSTRCIAARLGDGASAALLDVSDTAALLDVPGTDLITVPVRILSGGRARDGEMLSVRYAMHSSAKPEDGSAEPFEVVFLHGLGAFWHGWRLETWEQRALRLEDELGESRMQLRRAAEETESLRAENEVFRLEVQQRALGRSLTSR